MSGEVVEGFCPLFSFLIIVILYYLYQDYLHPLKHYINQHLTSFLKDVANKWKAQIDPRAYNALMNYQVEITD